MIIAKKPSFGIDKIAIMDHLVMGGLIALYGSVTIGWTVLLYLGARSLAGG